MHISKEIVSAKRRAIRQRFPVKDGWRWSVTAMDNNVGVVVALMQYPTGYEFPSQKVIEHHNAAYHCGFLGLGEPETVVITDACDILMDGWEEQSFYPQLRIGRWDERAMAA